MYITDIFIKRPVLAICLNLLLLVTGYYAIQSITTRQYPQSDMAVVKVTTAYIGANSDLVQGFVTTPLEQAIASADGIDYLESTSTQGLSTITAHLKLNYDVNDALTQIQSKVNQVRNDLPPEAELPSIDVETTDSRIAAIYLSFFSKQYDQSQITDYLTRVVQPKIAAVQGVQKADILGEQKFAMRVWLKPDKMAAMGISPREVHKALKDNNYLAAIGNTKGSMVQVNLRANTDLKTQEEFEQLNIKEINGTLIRLSDIADVVLGAEDYNEEVRFAGETAIFMGVWVLPNANSLDVIKEVRDKFPEIKASLPEGMKFDAPYDSTEYIDDAINDVLRTLLETIVIVILVIYFFIGSFRSVLVPIVAIPLSLVGGVALMYALGFTLNLLTLLAIVLAVGLVVDDAIVMLENVERHVQKGLSPFKAAIVAARELLAPTVSMTITLAAVYAPIGIQGGLTGALFREFAFTLAGAVLISGFVALTLSPVMSAKLVKTDNDSKLKAFTNNLFNQLRDRYDALLRKVLGLRPAVITAAILVIFCIIPFYALSMKELAPREDQGVIYGIVQAAPNSSIDQTVIYGSQINDIYSSLPEFQTSFQSLSPTFGFSGMVTKPWSQRNRSTLELEPLLWGKISSIPGIRVIITTPPPLPGGSDFPVEFVISSTDNPEDLYGYAQELVETAFQSGSFMYADADLKYDLPQTELELNREQIASMGLDLASVGQDISILTGGNYVNRFNIQGRSYKVIPQAKRTARLNPEQLQEVHVSGPDGSLIALETIAKLKDTVEPRSLNRFQQLNSVKIQGAIVPGTSIDQGLKILEEKAKEILPAGYQIDYAGESRQLRKEGGTLTQTLLMALVLIYLVLAAQFESFRDPFIILAGSVPLALSGALIFTFLGFTSLNIYSQIGLVTLIGIVAKNGILIVEFANVLRKEGLDKFEAVTQAATTRLRPILMTSIATMVGHFPLILASGAGAGARNSIGIVLVSGMLIGTIFTLFFVPVIYTIITGQRQQEVEEHVNGVQPINFEQGERHV